MRSNHKRYRNRIDSAWDLLRASQIESENVGRMWLHRNGFDFVYRFADNANTRGQLRRNFPFDYYAEKDGIRWFIDATTSKHKHVDVKLYKIFSRFSRVALLFVGRQYSYFKDLTNNPRSLWITLEVIDRLKYHDVID